IKGSLCVERPMAATVTILADAAPATCEAGDWHSRGYHCGFALGSDRSRRHVGPVASAWTANRSRHLHIRDALASDRRVFASPPDLVLVGFTELRDWQCTPDQRP